jgi:hypothetical protein
LLKPSLLLVFVSVSCGGGTSLDVGTGVNAPGVVAVGVAFAVLIEEEDVEEERSERPTARRKRSLRGIAVLVGLFSSKVERRFVGYTEELS